MLTSTITKRLDVPEQEGQWVQIRKLSWRKLREASDEQQKQGLALVRALGKDGMDAVKGVPSDQISAFKANPVAGYDPGTLLRAAIVGWSYSAKPTPEEIEDLAVEFVDWILPEIVHLAKPERDEAVVKNG